MFKAMKDNKIIAISDTDSEFPCLVKDTVETDETHTTADYDQHNGEYLLIDDIPKPSHDEQSEKRALAYQQEVDPITSHISRLRDKEQTPEVIAEIEQLVAERDAKVEEIKTRYPYAEE